MSLQELDLLVDLRVKSLCGGSFISLYTSTYDPRVQLVRDARGKIHSLTNLLTKYPHYPDHLI